MSTTENTTEDDRASSGTLEIAVTPRAHDWAIEIQDEGGCRRVPLARTRLVIGTSRHADLVVRDPTVSARHCALSALGSGISIEDLGSTNGTFVGCARVPQAWGQEGTVVSLGRSTLTIVAAREHDGDADAATEPLANVAGGSIVMRKLAGQVRRLARHAAPVLIAGETGTGKELIARALHDEGPRAERPFVPVNVSALPRDLVESELFGHERGAFTGAVAKRAGAFQLAEEGTLFLDEIGELPLDAQPKLLRALDGYEVRRVGASSGGKRADARVVAATHVPLEERVMCGLFRRDLFHRLEVFVVEVPPLRARRGDIGPIARALLARMANELGPRLLSPRALARLTAHDWPGNVRELRNVLFRAADQRTSSNVIDLEDVEAAMRGKPDAKTALTPKVARALFREHEENLSAAARAAKLPRTSFRKLLKG